MTELAKRTKKPVRRSKLGVSRTSALMEAARIEGVFARLKRSRVGKAVGCASARLNQAVIQGASREDFDFAMKVERHGNLIVYLKTEKVDQAKGLEVLATVFHQLQEGRRNIEVHGKQVVSDAEKLHGQFLATAKPFKTGGSQAIRLPASEAAGVLEWTIEKLEDGRLILNPHREKKMASDLLRRFAALNVDLFPEGREALDFPERNW